MERKLTDQEIIRRKKLQDLNALGFNPYCIDKYVRTCPCNDFKNKYLSLTKEQLHENKKQYNLAGRIMIIRQTFGVISDFSGKVQFYINKKEFNPQKFAFFKKFVDIGDIIGITGTPMKTNTNEVTIKVIDFVILSKALIPLPEKFHGLLDPELRARKRYLDLIVNEETKKIFIERSKIVKYLREYMDKNDYYEVETPILTKILAGAAAKPFITHHNVLDQNFYLQIATELSLKKLIVGGFEKVYEIGKIFRNEGMDSTHNPEFTSIEAYAAYANLDDMMHLCENLIRYIAQKINKTTFTYKNNEIDLEKPFIKISMVEMIKKTIGIDFDLIKSNEEAINLAKKHNLTLEKHQQTKGHIINLFFENYCEDKCLQPTFIIGHPLDVSPLAKKDPKNPNFTKRFELYICGKEYANAFAELNDPIDQLNRFENQQKEKNLGNKEASEIDWDFINALEYGMPPTGGIGIGIDRLVMLLTQKETINDVLLFPHMKNKK